MTFNERIRQLMLIFSNEKVIGVLKRAIFILGITAISLIFCWISLKQPRRTFLTDDHAFFSFARSIVNGTWFGYQFNLPKGPLYPLFIAAAHVMNIPLFFLQRVLYLFACLVLTYSVAPFTKNRFGSFILFAFLALCPVITTTSVFNTAIREAVNISLSLLIVASLVGVYVGYRDGVRKLGWLVILGISSAGFTLNREDYYWMLPAMSAIGILILAAAKRRGSMKSLALLLIPLMIIVLANLWIARINYLKYGIYVVTDMTSRDFVSVWSSAHRVKDSSPRRYVTISKESREKLAAVSPSFKKLEPFIDGPSKALWIKEGCKSVGVCDDFVDGWFIWSFRSAMAGAGYLRSGAIAHDFYRELAFEIDSACDSGKLTCNKKGRSLLAGWQNSYSPLVYREFFVVAVKFVNPQSYIGTNLGVVNDPQKISAFENFILEKVQYVERDAWAIRVIKTGVVWYMMVIKILCGFALFSFFVRAYLAFRYRVGVAEIMIFIGVMSSVLTFLVLLAVIDVTSYMASNSGRYLALVLPLFVFGIVFEVITFLRLVLPRILSLYANYTRTRA
ncbi:MAG: hypothetical protein WCJ29_00630 [bacterium]